MMARSRRKYRRSTSRNAASLLALALPAPFQRLANSQVGPLLVFFGVPALLVVGLLQIDWQNGTPHLKVNTEKASEFGRAVKGQLGNLENQSIFGQWEQTALDAWRSQPQYPQQQYPQQQATQAGSIVASNTPQGWTPSTPTANYPNGSANVAAVRNSPAPFPSTNPPSSQYISEQSPTQLAATAPNFSRLEQQAGGQTQYQQRQYPQQGYSQQQYPQQIYQQQQQLSAEQTWQAQTPWQGR